MKLRLWRRVVAMVLALAITASSLSPAVSVAYAEDTAQISSSASSSPLIEQVLENASSSVSFGEESSSVPQASSEPEADVSVPVDDSGEDDPASEPTSDGAVSEEPNSSTSVPAESEEGNSSSSSDSQSTPAGGEDNSSSTEDAKDDSSSTSTSADSSSQEEKPDSEVSDESQTGDSEKADSEETDESKPEEDDSKDEEAAKEEIKEFISLAVNDPENAEQIAQVGEEVTLSATLTREDVQVLYQWQKLQQAVVKASEDVKVIYDYPEGAPTWYNFVISDKTEKEALELNPDASWPGIELYYAAVDALEEAGADATNVSFEWRTPNYVLDGYAISAEVVDGVTKLYAEKDGQRFVATQNENGKWKFTDESEAVQVATENVWADIPDATAPDYTFVVSEDDYNALFRLKVTIQDEAYLAECLEVLEERDVTPTEEQLAAEQSLYSVVMTVSSGEQEVATEEEPAEEDISTFAATSTKPYISEDGQWICGLNGSYEYLTKDTYTRIRKWAAEGKITDRQFNRYWTRLGDAGWENDFEANVLDASGFPTGAIRKYQGFNLTDGKLEVASEWYGKTVLFRVAGTNNITEIEIPAYTELYGTGDKYNEAQSGSKYKKAIAFLNPFVGDTGAVYKYFLDFVSVDGWIQKLDASGNPTGKVTDNHIEVYTVNAELFNADPEKYLVDAEGNYRMDSVGWGVCTVDEPDISGKAYWVLKQYIANGYGFLAGHDTMYAYAGAYYDAHGKDLSEASIDPNDGTTWYYDINSWNPGTTAHSPSGAVSTTRGGHFYMNQLMGSNKGNVTSGTVTPADAPSQILSTGGSHGQYGKLAMYGSDLLNIKQIGFSGSLAQSNPRYRTPTNYPHAFSVGNDILGSMTHTNGQAAFGTIWVNYQENKMDSEWGAYADPMWWVIDGQIGTNNFYLTGSGNFLMNQIGHLPTNLASNGESILFSNSVMYVSQRKQCEICAAGQYGQHTSHFVRRVSSANVNEVLTALQNGGSYWYPIDGCYQLTEDITLPSGWTPIKGFKGHWNNDVYTVNLNGAKSVFDTTVAGGENGWNLGTNKNKGVQTVFNSSMTRTTGVARVVGDLNDLFGTNISYANYTVKILGSDNTKLGMTAGEVYSCTVNTDNKYVISNLPCLYTDGSGIMVARVYDTTGKEVTQHGKIIVRVDASFWETCNTTPLELLDFSAIGPGNKTIWLSQNASFEATVLTDDADYCANLKNNVVWQYKFPGGVWRDITDASFTYDVAYKGYVDTGYVGTSGGKTVLTVTNAPIGLTGLEFRIRYTVPGKGQRETNSGVLTVKAPEIATEITGDQTVWVRYADKNGNALDYSVKASLWSNTFGVAFNKPGYTLNNDNVATYKSTTTFTPKLANSNVPTLTWKYRETVLGTEQELGKVTYNGSSFVWTPNTTNINKIKSAYGASKLNITVTTSLTAQSNGMYAVTSYLKLDGVNTRMDSGNTRFFFRTTANSTYGSGKSTYPLQRSTTSAGLIVEYEVDIKANEGTKTQINSGRADWKFHNVKVYAPNGLRTGIVSFYHTNHAANDEIYIGYLPSQLEVAYQAKDYLIVRSKSGNLVPASVWEQFFRNLNFGVEDSRDSIVDDISWYIDEEDSASKFKFEVTGNWDTGLKWSEDSTTWNTSTQYGDALNWTNGPVNAKGENSYSISTGFLQPFTINTRGGSVRYTQNTTYTPGMAATRPLPWHMPVEAYYSYRFGWDMTRTKTFNMPGGIDSLDLTVSINNQLVGSGVTFGANNSMSQSEYTLTVGGRTVPYTDKWSANQQSLVRTFHNVLIDGILSGDKVSLNKTKYTGTYATANAGETLTAEGKPQLDRMRKLTETKITVPESAMSLTGDSAKNYYIANRIFSGAIFRQPLMAQVASSRTMYGESVDYSIYGKPWHDVVPYKAGKPASSGVWIELDGLQGSDTIALNATKSRFETVGLNKLLIVNNTTPVGQYELTYKGLTEANYPVLKNYLVVVLNGMQEVYAREIVVTVEEANRYALDDSEPQASAKFELSNLDGKTYTNLGSDSKVAYESMKLVGTDTIANTLLVGKTPIGKDGSVLYKEYGSGEGKGFISIWFSKARSLHKCLLTIRKLHPSEIRSSEK